MDSVRAVAGWRSDFRNEERPEIEEVAGHEPVGHAAVLALETAFPVGLGVEVAVDAGPGARLLDPAGEEALRLARREGWMVEEGDRRAPAGPQGREMGDGEIEFPPLAFQLGEGLLALGAVLGNEVRPAHAEEGDAVDEEAFLLHGEGTGREEGLHPRLRLRP